MFIVTCSCNLSVILQLLGTKGEKTQSTAAVLDAPTRVLFFTQLSRDGVACWNTKKTLKPENVALVATDSEKLIFTNDIRVSIHGNKFEFANYVICFSSMKIGTCG